MESLSKVSSALDETHLNSTPDGLYFSRKTFSNRTASYPIFLYDIALDSVRPLESTGLFLSGAAKMHYDPTVRKITKWGASASVRFQQGLYNRAETLSGHISAIGNILLLSIDSYGSYGVSDLYVCFNEDGIWSRPQNLGITVNSPLGEVHPFLLPDQKTLIFASNGREEGRSYDLYITRRLDDTWIEWTEPLPLAALNTAGEDKNLVLDLESNVGYYTSTLDSDGFGDIRRFTYTLDGQIAAALDSVVDQLPTIVIPDRNFIEPIFEPISASDSSKIKEGELVVNCVTNAVVSDTLVVSFEKLWSPLQIPPADRYSLLFKAPGFMSEKISMSYSDSLDLETIRVTLFPLKSGTIITLDDLLFDQGTDDLLPGSEQELEDLLRLLRENPDMRIQLRGHTDSRGNARLNLELSQERVDKVKTFLVGRGIDKNRIEGKGFGESLPIASNVTEESRKLNRRVEVKIL